MSMSMSMSRSLVFASLATAIACAPEGGEQRMDVDQEATAIRAVAAALPGLEGVALQVTIVDGLDPQTAPTAPDTTASPETGSGSGGETSSEPPRLGSGTYTTEVRDVLSAPHPADGVQVGDLIDLHFEETPMVGQYTLDGFVTVRQEGRQVVGYGAASFQSIEFDCGMEVWRDVRGTLDETGTLALTIETDTVVAGKECAMSAFGEARWDVEDYVVVGSL